MTRARALKQIIRARAAKTGERYTTARRHVLDGLRPRPEPVLRPTVPAPSNVTATTATPPAASKGVPSDAKVREKTGHGFDYWFAVLDRFGGAAKGHTALARHLYADHSVPGWHSQGITVAYERARGVRAANQRCDGEYEVSVSKVVSGTVADVVRAITDKRVRARWMKGISGPLPEALASALDSPASKGVVVRADGLARYRYNWGGTTVQLYIMPKAGGKASLVVTNSKLADSAMVEQRRALWRSALTALAQRFSRP